MNTISKIIFQSSYPGVYVKTYDDVSYYPETSVYCDSLEKAVQQVAKMMRVAGAGNLYPVKKKATSAKVKPDLHEKARIEQFMIETNSTPVKQTAAFKAKILGRAEKCSDSKKLSFASTLRWFGMEKLADEVETMVY